MEALKNIPIKYSGQLHDIKLINFSVEKEEVLSAVPQPLKVLDYKGRALISMVNVQLKDMRMDILPVKFHYRHIAFRLLLDDSQYDGKQHGIYFYQSFTDSPLMVWGGKMMTDFNLSLAKIVEAGNCLELKQGDRFLHYGISHKPPAEFNDTLKKKVGAVDRAYSVNNGVVKMLRISREEWPLEWVNCYHFQTNFFETARLEGAFRIVKPIDYVWNQAVRV